MKKLKVGIIGTGMIGKHHLNIYKDMADVEVLAVADLRAEEAARIAAEQGIPHVFTDYKQLLAMDEIDAVDVCLHNALHCPVTCEAFAAGKHVYCEKPLTLTIAEAVACIEAVRKYKRVMQTGSQQRSSVFGQFRLACELIRSGRIGKVQRVTVGVGGPSRWCDLPGETIEPGLDWDMWLGCAPLRPYNSILSPRGIHTHFPAWRDYREYSGGGMTDMGAHHFDIAQWALDMDTSGPVRIVPPEDPKAGKGVKFFYANGVEMEHGGKSGCTFYGDKGMLYIDRGKLTSEPESVAKEPLGKDEVHLYESPGHHREWLDCIRSRKQPNAHVEIGARSVTVCHLGNLAYWNRRTLHWDPRTWRFVGDEAANTWLDCPRRDPWHLPKL